jgi:hypothetical protein
MGRKHKCQVLSVETDYHIVEIEEPAYKELLEFCCENNISMDYFFFEFQEFAK